MRNGIILGIGILIILLALAGNVSASHNGSRGFNCNTCHSDITTENATFYNQTHRYNDTVINTPDCDNCHVSVSATPFSMDLTIKTGAGTLLTSDECAYCHPILADDWNLSNHSLQTPVVNCVTCHLEHNATRGAEPIATINTTCVSSECHYRSTGLKHSYNLTQCKYCHLPKVLTVNTTFDTRSHTWNYTTQLISNATEERHEAVFPALKNVTKDDGVTKASCDMCHGTTDIPSTNVRTSYRTTAHYNASANNVSDSAVTPYCTNCHRTANTTEAALINASNTCENGCHGSLVHVNASLIVGINCVNCHFNSSNFSKNHDMTVATVTDYNYTCTLCHTANSNRSIVREIDEWNSSGHKATFSNTSSRNGENCLYCHTPIEDARGITCSVCHNIHEMVDWLNQTNTEFGVAKPYGWYNKSVAGKYTMMENTTELCGNCHSNDRPRIYRAGPGWNKTTDTTPIRPHGVPAKDIFMGSPKQTGNYGIDFECSTCHMYKNTTYGTGTMNDSDKINGHSFLVDAEGLQNSSNCNTCHTQDLKISTYIEDIQNTTRTKWNSTNTTVMNALAAINASTEVKTLSREKIAQAYWNLKLVEADRSWGVHDRFEANTLLDEAAALAIEANDSLGMATSNVSLKAGWNNAALNGTPAVTAPVDVMDSVINNITVVWGFNANDQAWELYDPAMPNFLNDLTEIVPGKGYWIYANVNCWWTV